MKTFNRTIQIEVEVDAIAQQLRSMFNADAKFADETVEVIIGRATERDMKVLSMMYQVMNGYKSLPLPQVGEEYACEISEYGFWTPESIEKNDSVRGKVTKCKVIEIYEYSDEPLLVEFAVPAKDGTSSTKTRRISISTLREKSPVK